MKKSNVYIRRQRRMTRGTTPNNEWTINDDHFVQYVCLTFVSGLTIDLWRESQTTHHRESCRHAFEPNPFEPNPLKSRSSLVLPAVVRQEKRRKLIQRYTFAGIPTNHASPLHPQVQLLDDPVLYSATCHVHTQQPNELFELPDVQTLASILVEPGEQLSDLVEFLLDLLLFPVVHQHLDKLCQRYLPVTVQVEPFV